MVPRGQRFATVGHLYRQIAHGLEDLVEVLGELAVFLGSPRAQAATVDFGLTELLPVTDLASARAHRRDGGRAPRAGEHQRERDVPAVRSPRASADLPAGRSGPPGQDRRVSFELYRSLHLLPTAAPLGHCCRSGYDVSEPAPTSWPRRPRTRRPRPCARRSRAASPRSPSSSKPAGPTTSRTRPARDYLSTDHRAAATGSARRGGTGGTRRR
jgi:hypothetical protein